MVAGRPYYEAPVWKPRAVLPAEDALRGDFWPKSPEVKVDYDDPGLCRIVSRKFRCLGCIRG